MSEVVMGRWSIGRLRMAGSGVGDPGGAVVVVDEIPDPAAPSDLILPPLEGLAFPGAGSQAALEPVLAFGGGAGPGIGADGVEGAAEVPRRLRGELLPASGGVVAGETEVVFAGCGRGRGAVASLRAHYAGSGAGPRPRPPSAL